MRRVLLILLCALSLASPACFWKLWQKPPPPGEREYDMYGTVQSINPQQIVLDTPQGERIFLLDQASVKGGDFDPGVRVHVFYKVKEAGQTVTLVVEVRK